MKPKYTTYADQHPVYVRDLLLGSDDSITIHIKGNVESNLNVITKHQDMEEVYSRNVNETYIFGDVTEAMSFLNCETNKSLFCVLFNESLNNDEPRYYPLITNYDLSSTSISFKLETNYELERKETSRRIVDDLHYQENFEITITGENFNIEIINDALQPKLIPCEINLVLKINENLNEFAVRLVPIGDLDQEHLEEINRINPEIITDYIDKIDVKDTDILVTFQGQSHSCHETMTHYHNEAFRFKNIDTFKEFMEQTVREDDFFFIFNENGEPYGSFEFTEYANKTVLSLENDMDQWSDNLNIIIYYQDKKIGRKIVEYLEVKRYQ